MGNIVRNITSIKAHLPSGVKLVAVSKTKPASDIMEAYEAGQRIFGENRAGEMAAKRESLPRDIEWHQIGHLQTNKVKSIISFVNLIESVDSLRLLKVIDSEASKQTRTVDCLLQFHIATEDTKFGFSINEAEQMIASDEFRSLRNVRICGVMGMATFTDDADKVRMEFRALRGYFETLRDLHFSGNPAFCEISMGMSGDYLIAIGEGSTMVRIGSLIFGERSSAITPRE
jgi:PLP dependent protein